MIIRLLISLIALFGAIKFKRYFLLLIPFLQYAGFIFMKAGRPHEINFIICYAELILLLIFAFQQKFRIKNKISLYLFLLPFLSLPSLLFVGNLYFSLFIITLMTLSAFLYQFFQKNIDWFIKKNIFSGIVLAWIALGFITKIYQGIKWGRVLSPETGLYGVLSRGGGIGASNHIGGILLFFLPLIKNYKILLLANFFLLFTFSRSIYLLLILFWIIKLFPYIRIKKIAIKALLGLFIVGSLLWCCVPGYYTSEIKDWFILRTVGGSEYGTTISEKISARLQVEPRWQIYSQALKIFKETKGQGIGLGGFYWGQKMIGEQPRFSNAHNLYLTLLSEGGVLFLLGFVYLLFYMFRLAFKYNKNVLFALFLFTIWGFINGQIYEASMLVSCGDYYYLIFLLAYLQYIKSTSIRRRAELANISSPDRDTTIIQKNIF